MGWSEDEVVKFGVNLACSWILKRIKPEIEGSSVAAERVRKWKADGLGWALASSFVSRSERSGESVDVRRDSGGRSEITSVGCVLRTLAGERARIAEREGPCGGK